MWVGFSHFGFPHFSSALSIFCLGGLYINLCFIQTQLQTHPWQNEAEEKEKKSPHVWRVCALLKINIRKPPTFQRKLRGREEGKMPEKYNERKFFL